MKHTGAKTENLFHMLIFIWDMCKLIRKHSVRLFKDESGRDNYAI
ncbi:hypothetical protein BANRA_04319 [Klebsiella pneumoniae]|nr:hypothetical protein BANRA_04319 [Klebsiella pneumoniae]